MKRGFEVRSDHINEPKYETKMNNVKWSRKIPAETA